MAHPHLALAVVLLLIGTTAGIWIYRDGTSRFERCQLPGQPDPDAGLDILTPAAQPAAYDPADDGFGAEIYQPEQPATHLRHPHSALYVRSCSHGRHRS